MTAASLALSGKQKNHLRGLAHALHPLVIVGEKGLTESLLEETRQALEAHELIKVRVNAADREEREQRIETILEATASQLVQKIGHIAVLYRRGKKPKLQLPR
jgi:RNA-binding protein